MATVPFHRGAREIIAWFDADADAARQRVDERLDKVMDTLIERYRLP